MKLEPHKAQMVLYRAIGGDEYAAVITDVRDGLCSLTTFPPGFAATQISRCKYFQCKADAAEHKGVACYPPV